MDWMTTPFFPCIKKQNCPQRMTSCSIHKKIWGPALWRALHTFSFTYPVRANTKQQRAAHEWIRAFGGILPCPRCADAWYADTSELSALANDAERRRILAGRDALSRYLVLVHNRISHRIGKPTVAYDHVRAAYCGCEGAWFWASAQKIALVLMVSILAYGAYNRRSLF